MFLYRFEYRDAMAYDLNDLELSLQVVDQGSITHGAEHTRLSLASASTRIAAMQKALGAKLLDRCSDGLQSTLVVLANTSASQTLVPTALADSLATHSDVDVELQERPSHEIVAAVTRHFASCSQPQARANRADSKAPCGGRYVVCADT
jgi:DNA-binding transcriptional LysR family regulator